MLESLKLADKLAELLAGFQIVEGGLERLIACPNQRRSSAGAAQRQGGVQRPLSLAYSADNGVGVDLNLAQGHAGGVVGVDHDGALDRHARRRRIDQEQGQALIRLRREDQGVGDMAVQHEALGAVQLEAVAGAFGARSDLRRGVFGPFVDGETEDGLARRDPAQPLLLRL